MQYHKHGNAAQDQINRQSARELMKKLLQDYITLPELPESIAVRKLCTEKQTGYFIFNRAFEPVTFELEGQKVTVDSRDSVLWVDGKLDR
jgi:hypothetical protein